MCGRGLCVPTGQKGGVSLGVIVRVPARCKVL